MASPFVRNTLLSPRLTERIGTLPKKADSCAAIRSIVAGFEKMRPSAGEIQTELHLVKPILRVLGYAFDLKPQFFEEKVKGADFALFGSEEERAKSSPLWGTKPYYERVLALLIVKRYGRNLKEGIGGFYLEFENRIPLFQSMYLTKKAGVPWGILTNGKVWLLMKRPLSFEKPMIEIDLESAALEEDGETLHLFYECFSSGGLEGPLSAFLEEERTELIAMLRQKRKSFRALDGEPRDRERAALSAYVQLFPGCTLTHTAASRAAVSKDRPTGEVVREHDQCDVLAYLLTKGGGPEGDEEEIVRSALGEDHTKERLLSLKILDMTPGFGALAARLVETIAYLSFLLPYRERQSFVAEWEDEPLLYRFVLERVLYGVERDPFPLDVLQNALRSRFGVAGANYRLGNPLLGMSVSAVAALLPGPSGSSSDEAGEVLARIREMERLSSGLSDRIREDAALKGEIEARLAVCLSRAGEIMDLATASYFEKTVEMEKIAELIYYIEGEEEHWQACRAEERLRAARAMAARKRFFHMETQFPFLLNDGFDLVFAHPGLAYLWEEGFPEGELTAAYIKRAMTYLKQAGTIVLAVDDPAAAVSDLKRSRRYVAEARGGVVLVRRRTGAC